MASSSSENICRYCKERVTRLWNGWKLRNGSFAQLCLKCFLAYHGGTFCLLLHQHESGWRACEHCGKKYHCGCIMDLGRYERTDFHGITCKQCPQVHSTEGPNTSGSSQAVLNPKSLDRVTKETQDILLRAGLVPLFEKILTSDDAKTVPGRLVIPEPYAKEYLPEISNRRSIPIRIWDSEGMEYQFSLRSMIKENRQLFVFDGTRSCMRAMGWKAGDKLKFYRKEPEGVIYMELTKAQLQIENQSPSQARNLPLVPSKSISD